MSGGVKRFYDKAEAVPVEGGFALELDGRAARSPGRSPLVSECRALAEALAEEWAAQGETLDMNTMPLTRLQGQLLDAGEDDLCAWREIVISYAGTDLLCYRSGEPELAAKEAETWEPYLDSVQAAAGGERLAVTEGIVAVPQPAAALAGVSRLVQGLPAHGVLSARHMTEITGSAVLALAVLGGAGAEEAFAASRIDERHQAERWGEDAEAAAREAALRRDFLAVARFAALSEGE